MDAAKVQKADSESCHAVPSSSSGLIPNAVVSVLIEGRDTDICFMDFADKLFVVISQYKKLGNLILVTKDTAACTELQEPVYSTKVLFGKDEAEVHAAARHIVNAMQCPKAVLLSLALREISPAIVRSVAAAVATQLASINSPGHVNLNTS
ncbi:proteasome assembly chaperone 3-like [Amblyomma americanum]